MSYHPKTVYLGDQMKAQAKQRLYQGSTSTFHDPKSKCHTSENKLSAI